MIIADTGFFLALASARDAHHEAAKKAIERVTEPLVTTWPVMTEACHLFAIRLGPGAVETFIASAASGQRVKTGGPISLNFVSFG